MNPIVAMLDAYTPASREEEADVQRVRRLLGDGCDVWSRSEPLHFTGSALVVHPPSGRVLLRWHTRMERWMQVGGHGDPGETDPYEVASREAAEETGLRDLHPFDVNPVQVVIVPVPAHGDEPAHAHADIRYVFATEAPERAEAEGVGAPLRWLPFDHAMDEVPEENLREFIRRTRRLLA